MACKCGNCPAIRMQRGLLPFCMLPTPASTRDEGFGTYDEAAAARKPGQKVRSVGGLGTGSPSRFVLVARR